MTREGPPAVMPVAIAEPCAARGPTRGAQKLSIGNGHGSLLNKLASVNKSKAVAHPKPPLPRSLREAPAAAASRTRQIARSVRLPPKPDVRRRSVFVIQS